MEENLSLGRIAGIRVGINWSVLVIFWLITWSLATEVFPQEVPEQSHLAYWITGLVTATLFFSSLLAHEMGHSLLARRSGIVVEGITLWLFGGVSKMGGEASSARSELRVAAIGPAISLGIGLMFISVALLIDSVGASGLVSRVPAWLGRINIVLALFNLAPAYPLDGGRVLRAFLWLRNGDRIQATRTAARAGRFFGYFLISLGLLEFAAGGSLGGLWFVFLGWFLLGAARAEEEGVLLRDVLKDTKVCEVMTPEPVTVTPDISIEDLLEEYTFRHRFSAFPIVNETGSVTGLVTLAHIKGIPLIQRRELTVKDVARAIEEIPTADPNDRLVDLIGRMQGPENRVLVIERGHLVGIVTATDITRALEWATLRNHST